MLLHLILLCCLSLSFLPAQAVAVTKGAVTPSVPTATVTPPTGFLTPPASGDPLAIALVYLRVQHPTLGLTSADLRDIVVKDRYVSAHNGVTHLYLRQRLNGIEVFGGDINVNVTHDGRIINVGNRFVAGLAARVARQSPTISAITAVHNTATALDLPVREALVAGTSARGVAQAQLLSSGGLSADPIPVQLIYQPLPNGQVRLAWDIVLRVPARDEWLSLRADANTGEVLSQVNWVSAAQEKAQTAPPPNSYLVYGLPTESPLTGGRTLLTAPADPSASPFGWHDHNGVIGPEYTSTRGNNVDAYADLAAPTGFGAGDRTTDTGSSLVFSYTADLNSHPLTYLDAALTNLFYVTNVTHDLLYHYGFDEAAGNFQATNYSGNGQRNDAVKAEGQDYSGSVNANFATPPDGTAPIMQMYLGGSPSSLTINSPSALAGIYAASNASFGPQVFDLTGEVVLVNDGNADNGGSVTDGCQTPFRNAPALSGKIALLDRGTCTYKQKILSAQAAGAKGVIIANNDNQLPTGMGDTLALPMAVTIGSLLISQTLGDALKTQLALPTVVNSTLRRGQPTDGSLDNGIIIHEYGHGLSTRLTGGPSNSNCLSAQESGGLGEGWSDFLTLVLTARPTDQPHTPLAIGRWLMGQAADGAGIRRFPYTTDLNINPHTFATTTVVNPQVGFAGEVHDVGEVWAAMLWEVYWNLVNDRGFDANLYEGTGGNNLALQLVIDGLKLQPCNPTFVEARDAILLADLVNHGGAYACPIWAGFAKRGLGYHAAAGTSSTVADGVEAFDLPPACTLAMTPITQAICLPNAAQYTVALGPAFTESATLQVNQAPPNSTVSFSANPVAPLGQSILTINNSAVLPGWHRLALSGVGATQQYTATATLHLAAAAPATPILLLPLADATAVATTPHFVWSAVPQTTNYVLEVAEDPAFTSLLYHATVTTNAGAASTGDNITVALPIYLHEAQNYWWRVTAQNGCDTTVSTTANFTVGTFPRVLLVDDDSRADAADVRAAYANALAALNIGYDQWDTVDGKTEPQQLAQLADYTTIVWFTGPEGERPSAKSEALLAKFLDLGRCLVISAQDYHLYAGITPFMQTYLGVAGIEEDLGDGLTWQTLVTGAEGPFAGLGPYPLDFISSNYTDIMTPTVAAGVAFAGDGGNAALYQDGGHYRTSYWAFGFETLPGPQAQRAVMRRLLDFCNFQSDLAITQAVMPTTIVRPGQAITYTITYSNSGVAPAVGSTITATLPGHLTNVAVRQASPPLTPLMGEGLRWSVGELAPGATGSLLLTGIVSPALGADVTLTFQAAIGTGSYDGVQTNNTAPTTRRNVVVPRLQLAAPTFTSAESAGVLTVVATLDQLNPFGAVYADYRTTDGSAQAGGDYSRTSGRLFIPAGALTTTITIPLTDDQHIETPETLLIALSNPSGAVLGVLTSSQATILDNDQPAITLNKATYTVTENSGAAVVTVQLSEPHPYATVTVTYQLRDGSAQAASDYQAINGLLTIPAGTTAMTLTIPIMDDGMVEGDEIFTLTLDTATNALLSSPRMATITIIDDDQPAQPGTAWVGITSDPPPGTALSLGDQITYTAVVTNHHRSDARVTVTATLSSNLRYVVGSATPPPSNGEVAGATARAEILIWERPAISAGGQFQLSFVTQVQMTTDPIATALTVAIGDQLVITPPVVHPIQPATGALQAIFLPLIQR